MATSSTAPAPKPTTTPLVPADAPASVASKPVKEAAPAKAKHDWTRPFRYGAGFVGGTVKHTLNDMAYGARKGMWLGIGITVIGLLAGVPTMGLGTIAVGWAGGLLVGGLAGGAFGLATGGARGVSLEQRKAKYSDDLIERARAKSSPAPQVDYREAHREYQKQNEYMIDRLFQQQRENASDQSTYFQDRVTHSRMAPPHHEHGF